VVRFHAADGAEHRIRSALWSSPPEFEVGEQVEVVYGPARPGAARMRSFAGPWAVPVVLAVAAAPFLALGLVGLARLRPRRRRAGRPPPRDVRPARRLRPQMTLRLLHTSDWHLGRTLHDASLLEDQAWVLQRLVAAVKDARPDVLVVAGDVYDRAVPAADAVALLDEVLTEVAALGVPVVAVAGNHDSPERLSFGARLLAAGGVHLRGDLAAAGAPVAVAGKGLVYALPFVDPDVVRGLTGDEAVRGHPAATERALAPARAHAAGAAARGLPTVLVAHAFVQGAAETPDSERPLSVGTAGSVPAAALAGFDYVALGHLHAPQEVAPGVRYSGSLLKYSFSEAGHRKAALLVEVDRGAARVEAVPLGQRRDVVRLSGTLQQLLADPAHERHRGDLVEATLDDSGYVLDARGKLQQRFPFVLNVVRRALQPGGAGSYSARVAGAGGDDRALFEAFLETVAGQKPTAAEAACFAGALDAVERKERGA
jgi:exonuclease SbcD